MLTTKFHLPPTCTDLVARPRLLARLNTALDTRLTLLSAPAGFGKTMLVTEWLSQRRPEAAVWVSLDEADNHLHYFWRAVIAGLQTILPAIGVTALSALDAPQPATIETILGAVINDLAAQPIPLLIILDDYHLMESEDIHHSLNLWLDRMPQQTHVIITTREDPPLALHRRRARAEMIEIRASDLRFTLEEVELFLNSAAGLDLPADDVAALAERTEGWIAGLRLAVLSMQDLLRPEDQHRFVTTFAGNDRYVMDYLVEEVLQRQPFQLQDFLLRTSLLVQLCGPLCEAVTGDPHSQQVLESLERAGLFVLPLDHQRQWYRYHHLFADLLRQQLERTSSAGERSQLSLRASAWCEREGLTADAVYYALASDDNAYTSELIERHALDVFYRSEIALLQQWLKALPVEVLHTRPLLAALQGNIIALAASGPQALEQARQWLLRAERSLASLAQLPETGGITTGFVATFRAYLAAYLGEPPETVLELSRQAWDSLPPTEERFRSALANRMALAYTSLGDHSSARQALVQARDIGLSSGDLFNAAGAIYFLARLTRQRGELKQAAHIARQGLDMLPAQGKRAVIPYAGTIYLVLGAILLEWNELTEADEALQQALTSLQLTAIPQEQANVYLDLSQLRQAQGDVDGAFAALAEAERLSFDASAEVVSWRVHLWLAHNPPAAVNWLRTHPCDLGLADHCRPEQLAAIRVCLAHPLEGGFNWPDCLHFLDEQLRTAEASGQGLWKLQAMLLKALVLQVQSEPHQAAAVCQQALDWAAPQGFVRSFINMGGGIEHLLRRLPSQPYASRLLAAFAMAQPVTRPASSSATLPSIDMLSQREIEVLQCIAAGASNAEIAGKLYISLHTVKKHITNIFGKLGVANRVQAVKRGQDLHLL